MAVKKNPMKILAALIHNETDNELPLTFYSLEGIPYRKRVSLKPRYQGLITSLVLFKIEFELHNPFIVEKWLEMFISQDPTDPFGIVIKGGVISTEIRENVMDYVMISNYLRLLHLDTGILDLQNRPKDNDTFFSIDKQPITLSRTPTSKVDFLNKQLNNLVDGDRHNVTAESCRKCQLCDSFKDNDEEIVLHEMNDEKRVDKNIFGDNKNNKKNSTSKIEKTASTKRTESEDAEKFRSTKWADDEIKKAYDYMKNELVKRPYRNAIKRVMHHKFRYAYEILSDEKKRYLYKRFIYSSWKRIKCTRFFCCTDKKCSRQFHGLFFFIMFINIIFQIFLFAEASKKRVHNFTWRAIFESTAVLFASINDFLLSSTTDWPYEEKIMCCVYPDCHCFSLTPPKFIPFLFISILSDLLCGTGMSLITVDLYDVLDNKYRLPLILVDAVCSTLMITLISIINDIKKKVVVEALVGRLYPSMSLYIAVFRNLTETMVSVVAFGAFGGTICGLIKSRVNLEETGLDEFFFYYFQLSNASLRIVKWFASGIRGLCRQLGHVIKRTMETKYERELPSFSQIKLRRKTSLVERTDELTRIRHDQFEEADEYIKPVPVINIAARPVKVKSFNNLNEALKNTTSNNNQSNNKVLLPTRDEDWTFYSDDDDNPYDNPDKKNKNKNQSTQKFSNATIPPYQNYTTKDDSEFNFITFDNKSGFLTVLLMEWEGCKKPKVLEDLESITIPTEINNVKLSFRTWRIIPYCVPYFCKCPCNLNRAFCNGCLGCCFRLVLKNVLCDWPYYLCWKTLPAWNRSIDFGGSCARCMKRFNIFCCIYRGKNYVVKHEAQRVYVLHTLCTRRSLIEQRDIFEEVIVV